MPTTVRPDTTVYWQRYGDGVPLILLHGLGGDGGFWQAHIPHLSSRLQVITVDLRGSGRTPSSRGGHEIDDLADDVAAVLDDVGIARAHVLGFSMGGYVAQAFAVRHQHRLDRLVLAATSACLNGQIRMFVDAVLDAYEAGIGPARMFKLVAPFLFSTAFAENPAHSAFFVYPEDDPYEQSLNDWREQYLAQRRFDGRARLERITAPTLVLVGGEDAFVSRAEARDFAARIPGSHLKIYDAAGHLINLEAPDRFTEDVIAHLGVG